MKTIETTKNLTISEMPNGKVAVTGKGISEKFTNIHDAVHFAHNMEKVICSR